MPHRATFQIFFCARCTGFDTAKPFANAEFAPYAPLAESDRAREFSSGAASANVRWSAVQQALAHALPRRDGAEIFTLTPDVFLARDLRMTADEAVFFFHEFERVVGREIPGELQDLAMANQITLRQLFAAMALPLAGDLR